MRILLCTSEIGSDAGGLALHCGQLKDIFEELGNEVFVEVLLNPNTFNVIDGGYDSELGAKIRQSSKLKSMIHDYVDKVDICVSCGAGKTAYYAMLFCQERKIPLYVVLCGSEVNLSFGQPALAFYNTEVFRYATAVIGLSEELNGNAQRLSNNSKCQYYVIPNYCDLKSDTSTVKRKAADRVVYASGATFLGEKKGISNLLKAFSVLIHKKNRDDLLYLYGNIDNDIKVKYQQMITDMALEQNVILCGYLDRNSFHEKMKEVDVYIQASPFEGFGNSVAEALSLGKDILISDTGYIAELIGEDYSSHVMKSLEPEKMAADMYRFSTEVFYMNEAESIRLKLACDLDRRYIVEKWRKVLEGVSQISIDVGFDSCIAVMFHDISCDYTAVDYSPKGFEELLKKIYERGLRLVSARDFFQHPQPEKMIICTFDDGYESVYRNALPVMQRYGFTATVYVCPDLIGMDNSWNHKDDTVRMHMNKEMIDKLWHSGWEIGSHGLSHINLLRLSEHELEDNLVSSKKQLSMYGSVESFCYPYGKYNSFIKEKVKQYYKNAFSVDIGGNNYINDLYQITRLTPEQLIKRLEI